MIVRMRSSDGITGATLSRTTLTPLKKLRNDQNDGANAPLWCSNSPNLGNALRKLNMKGHLRPTISVQHTFFQESHDSHVLFRAVNDAEKVVSAFDPVIGPSMSI